MLCPIQAAADQHSAAPALVAGKSVCTYGEWNLRIDSAVRTLEELGVGPGDRLGLSCAPSIEYVTLLAAAFRLGAVACPFSPLSPVTYLANRLSALGCRWAIIEDERQREGLGVIVWDTTLFWRDTVAMRRASGHDIPRDRPAAAIWTSGSTGAPKAALLSYGNFYHNARQSNANIPVKPGSRWLLSLPLHHVAGLGILFRSWLGGGAVVLPEQGAPIADTLANREVTHTSLVAAQLQRLLDDDGTRESLARLEAILLGGGPLPEPLLRRAHEAGLPVFATYGLTEMASQVTVTRPGDGLDRLLTAGKPLDASAVALSSSGEIVVRGDTLFLGYAQGEMMERTLDARGFFPTGDLGKWDANGCLCVTGRKDNVFISGGENIQPEEIEACLASLPSVARAVVAPVPHSVFGAVPVAFVQPAGGGEPDPATLTTALAARLPKFKVPRQFYPWPRGVATTLEKPDRPAFARRALNLSKPAASE